MAEIAKRKELTKSDLMKSFMIWELTSEMCLSYERLMSLGFCHAMLPIVKKLYGDNKEEMASAMTRHMAFFNTENNWGAIIPGIVASMEEERANGADYSDETINALKVGLMGPMAGIGDTVTQGLVKTITLSVGVSMALDGNVFGPLLFFVLYTAYILGIGYFMFFKGYKLGKSAFSKITDSSIVRRFTDCMSVLGMTVAGCMVATYVGIYTSAEFTVGDTVVQLQPIFDEILPGFLSVLAVFGVYGMLKKNVSVMKIMLGMLVLGAAGAIVGFF